MTSIDTNSKVNNDVSNSNDVDRDREPGASLETMLVTTDSYEEIETENFMSSSLDEQLLKAKLETGSGSISEIQEKFNDVKVDEQKEEDSSKLNNQVTPDGTIDVSTALFICLFSLQKKKELKQENNNQKSYLSN